MPGSGREPNGSLRVSLHLVEGIRGRHTLALAVEWSELYCGLGQFPSEPFDD